jgi:hypothetical protein
MSSPSFGLTSNNAPLPAPGATNPTGTNTGLSLSGGNFPSYSSFGSTNGLTPLSSNMGTPMGGLASLSSGFGSSTGNNPYNQQFYNMLGKVYGQGTGQELGNIFQNGLFNPQVAQAMLNAMQPGINQGTQTIQNQFGAEGARFGSEDSLGLSNYLGQANLNEQQTLASMYEQAQTEQLQLLAGVLPSVQAERADTGGFMNTFADLTNVVGGVAGMVTGPIPGGASMPSVKGTGNTTASATPASIGTSSAGTDLGGVSNPGSDFGTMSSSGLDSFVGDSSAGEALGGSAASTGIEGLMALA